MTFLPILGRELRVRARSRANYWGRFAVAAIGVLVCAPPLIWSGPFATPGATGRGAFDGLVSAAFLLCCAACLFTSDTISSERREGTLGLLLLTRVKHFDVLLGKFASSGLACLLGLLAFLPVLALPLLTGGVTGGEAARKAAALLDTLFLALSVGLWASARGLERFRTARAAVLVLAGLVLGPGLLGRLLPNTHAGMASPLGTILQAADLAYKTSATRYWVSLGVVQIVGWALLLSAMACLRHRVGESEYGVNKGTAWAEARPSSNDRDLPPSVAVPASSGATPSPTKCRYCGRPNYAEADHCHECGSELYPREPQETHAPNLSSAPTPLHWLLRRQCGLKPMLWVAAAIGFCHFGLYGMFGRFFSWGTGTVFLGVAWSLGLVTTAITGSLFAWVASRFFIEARHTGELELLLTTPLGAQQIVSTQWDFLKRLVRLPVLVMLVPLVFQGLMMLSLGYRPSGLWRLYYAFSLLLNAANTVLSVGALCWLALWFGLRVMGQARAIFWTVLLAEGLPWVLGLAWSLLYRSLLTWVGSPASWWTGSPWLLVSLAPQLATLLFYLWLIRLARWQLFHELAGAEPFDLPQIFSRALPRITAAIRRARQWSAV